MLQISTVPISGGQRVLNNGACRCAICGAPFDEGDICNNGHEWGKIYYILSELPKTRKIISLKGRRN